MTRSFRKEWILPVAVMMFGLVPSVSWATPLTIATGNGPPNTTVQLVEPTGTTGTTFHGENNTLGLVMTITTNVEGITQGTGQAQIVPHLEGNFTSVLFEVAGQDSEGNAYLGWTGFEVLPNFSDSGYFTVTGVGEGGASYSATFPISNAVGQNRFFVLPDEVQYITSVLLATSTTLDPPTPAALITKVEQFRIGGVVLDDGTIVGPPVVPEPSTLALAIGCIAPLAAIRIIRRRRQLKADGA